MASLKEMRNRISSVKATQKITKAMQMVAAAKLRRAQDAATSARPYARRMAAVIANLAGSVSGPSAPRLLAGTGSDQKQLVVVATADRGLAGGFNGGIARAARDHISSLIAQGKQVQIICIGRKGRDVLRRLFGDRVIATFEVPKVLGMEGARPVAELVLQKFEAGEADVVTLFYSRFKSVISQIPTAQQIIPAQIEAGAGSSDAVYDYEPDEGEILTTLLPRNLTIQIFRALLENAASEQGARMSAMDNATRNAGEMIKKQTMTYNRSRQAMITKELIEIISGAEAL